MQQTGLFMIFLQAKNENHFLKFSLKSRRLIKSKKLAWRLDLPPSVEDPSPRLELDLI